MKIGDIANIRGADEFWKGKVTKIVGDNKNLVIVIGIGCPGHSMSFMSEFEFKDGEYWELPYTTGV